MKHFLVVLCAWILWGEYTTITEKSWDTNWQPHSAYPENAYDNCIIEAKDRAQRLVSTKSENLKKAEMTELFGKAYHVKMDFVLFARSISVTFQCFPDTIKPQRDQSIPLK